ELHALANSTRGDLLSLGLARLATLSPRLRRVGLSATVAAPDELRGYLMPQPIGGQLLSDVFVAPPVATPDIGILVPLNPETDDDGEARIPWSGHSARHAMPDVYEQIKTRKTTLVFVNTRS